MSDYLLSSYTTPAHNLSGFTDLTESFGSDVGAVNPWAPTDYVLTTGIPTMAVALSLQAGSEIGELTSFAFDISEAGVSGSLSIATSSGSGSGSAPTTGQIFPRGTN